MSVATRPPFPQLIPDSAPFTPEQRTWLNGFFSGLVSLEGGAVTPLSADESAAPGELGVRVLGPAELDA